jgi:hypothetical protein
MSATWPFARLTVSTGKISLRCFRKYELSPRDVICEPYGFVPLLSGGVQFHHIRADYPFPLIAQGASVYSRLSEGRALK